VNRWLLIRRARGPAFLILVGLTALLNQWGILSFGRSWPLYLILAGVLLLAERAALAGAPPRIPGQPYGQPPVNVPGSMTNVAPGVDPSTSTLAAPPPVAPPVDDSRSIGENWRS
jgi:LiaI-LiaF-like transmembrane region